MPFTFAHPIYALPLRKLRPAWFSLTGLVLGAMGPDFEYFLALEPYATIGHSIKGLVLQVIPLSVLFAILFHFIVKRELVRHLPAFWQLDRRAAALITPWQLRTWRQWIVFVGSVVIGFATHIFVDAWTHEGGSFVQQWAWLQQPILLGSPAYKLLQYGLSLLGLIAEFGLIVWLLAAAPANGSAVLHESRADAVNRTRKMLYWAGVALCGLLTTAFKLWLSPSYNTIGIIVVAPISGSLLGLLLVSCWSKRSMQKRR